MQTFMISTTLEMTDGLLVMEEYSIPIMQEIVLIESSMELQEQIFGVLVQGLRMEK